MHHIFERTCRRCEQNVHFEIFICACVCMFKRTHISLLLNRESALMRLSVAEPAESYWNDDPCLSLSPRPLPLPPTQPHHLRFRCGGKWRALMATAEVLTKTCPLSLRRTGAIAEQSQIHTSIHKQHRTQFAIKDNHAVDDDEDEDVACCDVLRVQPVDRFLSAQRHTSTSKAEQLSSAVR